MLDVFVVKHPATEYALSNQYPYESCSDKASSALVRSSSMIKLLSMMSLAFMTILDSYK